MLSPVHCSSSLVPPVPHTLTTARPLPGELGTLGGKATQLPVLYLALVAGGSSNANGGAQSPLLVALFVALAQAQEQQHQCQPSSHLGPAISEEDIGFQFPQQQGGMAAAFGREQHNSHRRSESNGEIHRVNINRHSGADRGSTASANRLSPALALNQALSFQPLGLAPSQRCLRHTPRHAPPAASRLSPNARRAYRACFLPLRASIGTLRWGGTLTIPFRRVGTESVDQPARLTLHCSRFASGYIPRFALGRSSPISLRTAYTQTQRAQATPLPRDPRDTSFTREDPHDVPLARTPASTPNVPHSPHPQDPNTTPTHSPFPRPILKTQIQTKRAAADEARSRPRKRARTSADEVDTLVRGMRHAGRLAVRVWVWFWVVGEGGG
ncbi:unnamed protein product [Peniophora sp. CBMAI 1063]|nr:unnamed protein product [Peniophora sp. CBMAI 1063]